MKKVAGHRWQVAVSILALCLCVPLCGMANEQEKSAAPPAPEKSAPSVEAPKSVAVPAEIQELLADRDLLSAEIERIVTAEGDAVKIPVSLRALSARREAKTQRFLAWLDANKIPREWGKAGWRLDKWVFIPPASVQPAKAPEAKP
jgi:hypothetical protein